VAEPPLGVAMAGPTSRLGQQTGSKRLKSASLTMRNELGENPEKAHE
jgi:hypothetical protein